MLKLIGGYYLSLISDSVTASAFGGAVGLLVWINLVARFAFFTAGVDGDPPVGGGGAPPVRRSAGAAGPPPDRRRPDGPARAATGDATDSVAATTSAARPPSSDGTVGDGPPARRGDGRVIGARERRGGASTASASRRAGVGAAAATVAGLDQLADAVGVRPGAAKPQSSSRRAWSAARSGRLSVSMTLTTSRRPSRSAAATKVCRAASVKPVFPPRLPG